MSGRLVSLHRHPVKGFTPERLDRVRLEAGAYFPCDRMYAVEDGPSGFDPTAPGHVAKQRFTVLANYPAVARARTRYDEASATLSVTLGDAPAVNFCLAEDEGRDAFATWLTQFLGDEIKGPLQVLPAPGAHRFMDHPRGYVSIVNLASVRALEQSLGVAIDPLRFRANLYVEGWPAWIENDATDKMVRLGAGEGRVVKPITRCIATHANPMTGERDVEVLSGLFGGFGHVLCGIYVDVTRGGDLAAGDEVELAA